MRGWKSTALIVARLVTTNLHALLFKKKRFPPGISFLSRLMCFQIWLLPFLTQTNQQTLHLHLQPSEKKKNPIKPFMESSQPHANQTNILTSSQNSLTPQKPDLWSHNPIAATKPHAQVTPSHISTSTNRLETPIEYTLNALSLFQKPIQLFSSNLSPSPSLTNQTIPLIPN
jgi:hypothetical protein